MAESGALDANFDRLWDYGDPGASERRFRKLLPAAERGANRGLHIELLTQIARSLGLQQRFDEAHAMLDRAETMLAGETKPEMERARIRYWLERGRVLNSSGERERADGCFRQAWEAARRAGEDFHAVDAAHMLAITAPDWNLAALAAAEASDQPRARGWLGSLYNNIGWTHHAAGDFDAGLEMFRKALAWQEQNGTPEMVRVARWCVARGLRSLGRVEVALAEQEALLVESEAAGEEPGYTYEEIGECLLALGRAEEARPYFARAYQALGNDPWLQRDEPERIRRWQELAAR
jgi:tetratricopeptide (TPR) repeat protein